MGSSHMLAHPATLLEGLTTRRVEHMYIRVKCSEESLSRGEGRAAMIDSTHEAQPSEIFISMQTTSKVIIISFKTLALLVIHGLISSLTCDIENNLC